MHYGFVIQGQGVFNLWNAFLLKLILGNQMSFLASILTFLFPGKIALIEATLW